MDWVQLGILIAVSFTALTPPVGCLYRKWASRISDEEWSVMQFFHENSARKFIVRPVDADFITDESYLLNRIVPHMSTGESLDDVEIIVDENYSHPTLARYCCFHACSSLISRGYLIDTARNGSTLSCLITHEGRRFLEKKDRKLKKLKNTWRILRLPRNSAL